MSFTRLQDYSVEQLHRLLDQAIIEPALLRGIRNELEQRPLSAAQRLLGEVELELTQLELMAPDQDQLGLNWQELLGSDPSVGSTIESTIELMNSAQLLQFWLSCEWLTPQVYKNEAQLIDNGDFWGDARKAKASGLPWPAQPRGEQNVYFHVFLGQLDLSQTQRNLCKHLAVEHIDDSVLIDSPGFTPLMILSLDQRGIPCSDGLKVSAYAWAYGRVLADQLDLVAQWPVAHRLLLRRLRRQLRDGQHSEAPVSLAKLGQVLGWLVETLGISAADLNWNLHITREYRDIGRAAPRPQMLDSFISDDLRWLSQQLQTLSPQQPLYHYLHMSTGAINAEPLEADCLAEPTQLASWLNTKHWPLACWPHPDRIQLDQLQQIAVNYLHSHQPALFAIHGPPGTGKTIVLRDVIVSVLAKRWQAMCDLSCPTHGFMSERSLRFADQRLSVYEVHPALCGFEIVVAASNNRAVENISLALPSLHELWQPEELDYFRAQANSYWQALSGALNNPHHNNPNITSDNTNVGNSQAQGVWGLMAAALGSVANRQQFLQSVWFNEDGLLALLTQLQAVYIGEAAPVAGWPHSRQQAMERWQIAQEAYLAAYKRCQVTMAKRELDSLQADYCWRQACPAAVQAQRFELFKLGMALQQAFLLVNVTPMLANLTAAMRVLAGVRSGQPELLSQVWTSLSLLVPVISTPLASVQNMFAQLPMQGIGYLLVDEAGQVCPQDVLGALARARHGVIVGDVQQLPPVTTMPVPISVGLGRHFAIDAQRWAAPLVSAQALADRVNPLQTILRVNNDKRHIGFPLLVHRRCSEPMFAMINRLAYGNLMVQAKGGPGGCASWLHSVSLSADKWCPEEGEAVLALIGRLRPQWPLNNIGVITPFRACVAPLRKLCRDMCNSFELAWLKDNIGTVHTFQGRQCAVIVLVLGAQSEDQLGARLWASQSRALLNVAISRAQTQLYIVGNQFVWQELGVWPEVTSWLES